MFMNRDNVIENETRESPSFNSLPRSTVTIQPSVLLRSAARRPYLDRGIGCQDDVMLAEVGGLPGPVGSVIDQDFEFAGSGFRLDLVPPLTTKRKLERGRKARIASVICWI